MASLKTAELIKAIAKAKGNTGNNQSDGVMLDEHWSTVDSRRVISMAAVDLLTQSDRSEEKDEREGGGGEGGRAGRNSSKMTKWVSKKFTSRGWRQAIKLLDNRDGSQVAGYSLKTKADVMPFHCILDRCSDLCFVILVHACLSARAPYPFLLQLGRLSWGHWTITLSNQLHSINSKAVRGNENNSQGMAGKLQLDL